MNGYRTRLGIPDEYNESAEYIETGVRIALGQAVYNCRTALGLSRAELASWAGTTQTVISRLEGGSLTPTLPLLQRLAGALGEVGEPAITVGMNRSEAFAEAAKHYVEELDAQPLTSRIDAAIDLVGKTNLPVPRSAQDAARWPLTPTNGDRPRRRPQTRVLRR